MIKLLGGIDHLVTLNSDLQDWAGKLGFNSSKAVTGGKRKRKDAHEW